LFLKYKMALITTVNINQGICGCDGSLAINTLNGAPPYSYSIDGGISFRNTPLFTNLCSGAYTIVVNDSLSGKSVNSITLTKPNEPISYNVYLTTTSSVIQNNGVTLTLNYITTLNVTPALTGNTYITFDLLHTNNTKSSPTITASTTNTSSSLLIDSISIPASLTGVTTGATYNQIPGCQNETLYVTTTTEEWNSLTFSGGTQLSLNTTTSTIKNTDVNCYLSNSEEFYTLSNVRIYGCSCCTITSI
jgi:hypothetical protein